MLQQKHNAFRKLLNAQQYLKSNHGDLLGHADIIGSCVYSYIMISEASFKNYSRKPVNRCQNLTTELSQDTYLNTTFKNVFSKVKNKKNKNKLTVFSLSKGILWDGWLFYPLFPVITDMIFQWSLTEKNMQLWNYVYVRKNTLCYDLF